MDIKNIVIIGAGVIGATCAVKLIENLGSNATITIVSDQFSPNTTGNVSAGLWGPFLLNDTPEEKIMYVFDHFIFSFFFFVRSGCSFSIARNQIEFVSI